VRYCAKRCYGSVDHVSEASRARRDHMWRRDVAATAASACPDRGHGGVVIRNAQGSRDSDCAVQADTCDVRQTLTGISAALGEVPGGNRVVGVHVALAGFIPEGQSMLAGGHVENEALRHDLVFGIV